MNSMKWEWIELETETGTCRSADGAGLCCGDVRVECVENKIYLTAGESRPTFLRLRMPRRFASSALFYADHWGRAMGDLQWLPAEKQRAVMPWYFIVCEGENVSAFGVKTNPNAICSWRYTDGAVLLTADVRNGTSGVCLNGRTLEVCTTVEATSREEPFAFARRFCRLLCDHPLLPPEPVYGGNDWYCSYGNSTAQSILTHAERIAECSSGNAVRPFMTVDDGWQLCRNLRTMADYYYTGGPWQYCNSRFGDMKKLAGEIRAMNVRPGIWLRPLQTIEYMPEECHQKEPMTDPIRSLDPSHPLTLKKLAEDIACIRGWGYELIKFDYTSYDTFGLWEFEMTEGVTGKPFRFYDQTRTTAEIFKNLYRTIKEAAQDMLVVGCNAFGHLGAGWFDLQRTGGDTSGLEWERTVKMGVNTLAFRMMQDQAFFASDADCVGLTRAIPWEKNSQWLELLSRSGTPLFVSIGDDRSYGAAQKEAIAKAFRLAARKDQFARPLDWMTTLRPAVWECADGLHRFNW